MDLSRRSFLLRSGMTAAGLIGFRDWNRSFQANAAGLDARLSSIQSASIPLRDWSGFTVLGETVDAYAPTTESEVVQIVQHCAAQSRQCRVVGRRTSWNVKWYGDPRTVLISSEHLQDLVFDSDAATVTCGPGVLLETLHREAWARGLTLSTSPAPPWVTIGGAVATGSHGSLMAGSLSSSLIGCHIVKADGSVEVLDSRHPDLDAARISMGMLGVMTQLTLQLEPAYRLTLVQQPIAVSDWREALVNSGPMSFVHASTRRDSSTLFKVNRAVSADESDDRILSGKDAQGHAWITGPAHLVAMNYQPPTPTIAGGEWAVPLDSMSDVLMVFRSIASLLPDRIWLKKVRGESAWLAGGSDPEKVYVQLGSYHEVTGHQSPQIVVDMVKEIERIMIPFGGRPHFAKLTSMSPAQLSAVHPELQRFHSVRKRWDPANVFYTQRLSALFG